MTSPRTRLARAIGIEPGEGPVFVWAASTVFLVALAGILLSNVADTFFLKRVGVRFLPVVFLVGSLLLALTTFLASRLAARHALDRLLPISLFGLAATILPLYALVLADVRSAFVVLVLAAKQIVAIAAVVFWAALAGLLHGRQAKRLYAPIIAGATLGEIVGSFASGPLGRIVGIPALLPLAALVLTLAGVLAFRLRGLAPTYVTDVAETAARRPDLFGLLRPLWRESRLFRLLSGSALLSGALSPMLYFQFSYIADLATQGMNGEQRLLQLYSQLRGFINVGILVIQLVGTARIFRRIGVPLAATLSPVVYLLGFVGVSSRLELGAAVGAVAGANLQDHAVYEPAEKVLTTLFPERVRASVTAWIGGPARRLGGALGNIAVLLAIGLASPAWVGWMGLPVATLWLAIAISLWRVYPSLLLEVVHAGAGRRHDTPAFRELMDPGTLRVFEASLADRDAARVRAACELVVESDPERAALALTRAVGHATSEGRPLVIDALATLVDRAEDAPQPGAEAARTLETLLEDPAADLRDEQRAILVRIHGRLAPDMTPGSASARAVDRSLAHPAAGVRFAAGLRPLRDAPFEGAPPGAALDPLLDEGLASDDPATRRIARAELRTVLLASEPGSAGFEARLARLTDLLGSARERAPAAAALADVAGRHGSAVAGCGASLLAYAEDADPRVRAAVLRFIGDAGLADCAALAVEHLTSSNAWEAQAADEALRRLGPSALGALVAALHTGSLRRRHAALPLLREISLDAAALRALAEGECATADDLLRQRRALARPGEAPVHALALQRLAERASEALHGALLVLAALAKDERIATLARLLARTRAGRGRALLLEALEALLPQPYRARVMPLLEDAGGAPQPGAKTDALGRPLPPRPQALREALGGGDALTRDFLLADPARFANHAPQTDFPAERDVPSRIELILHLRGLDLFSRLTTRQLDDVAGALRAERHAAGAVVLRAGEFGDCMYLVVSGELALSREGRVVAQAGPGEIFGELALFDGENRSATVMATSAVELLRLEQASLFALLEEQPGIAIGICQTLSRKMRELIHESERRRASPPPGA